MASNFYSDILVEPKRSNRFFFYLNDIDVFVVRNVAKPSFSVSTAERKFGQHRFRWPGSVTWNDVSFTITDAANPDSTAKLVNHLVDAGYLPPSSFDNSTKFLSKAKMVTAIGVPRIVQIDADGKPLEEWRLHNAFIVNADFGKLDYENDSLVDISLTISYDWATLNGTNPASKLVQS